MLSLIATISQEALCIATVFVYFIFFLPVIARAEAPAGKLEMPSLLTKGLKELVEIEVSLATGTSKPLKLAPAVAAVITAEEIEAMGATTLEEVLETVPGLHVVLSTFNRTNSCYSIRGILTKENAQVLLLPDGHPIRYSVKGNRPDTFNTSTANISRIEVIRGPGSALYGADAFAGTMDIFTKKPLRSTVRNLACGQVHSA